MHIRNKLHESDVVHIHVDAAHAHLALDGADGFQRNAHSDQDGARRERHAHPRQPQQQRRLYIENLISKVKQNILSKTDVSPEVEKIIDELKALK